MKIRIITLLCAATLLTAVLGVFPKPQAPREAFLLNEALAEEAETAEERCPPGKKPNPDAPCPPDEVPYTYTLAATTYTVQAGDSLWKIAVKFEIGLSELIKANPQIANPAQIYVGQKITIPNAAPLQSVEQEIFTLVNRQRGYSNLPLLTYNWQAARVARIKSQDMIDSGYFAHISPSYGSPFKMLESFGLKFSAAAENIAYGQQTAQAVMNSWMNSAGHKANILSRSVTQIGVGVAKASNGTLYFTQLFLKPVG